MKLERRDAEDVGAEAETPREPATVTGKERSRREKSAILYTTLLFIVALGLIALSYFIQKRANETMDSLNEQHGQFTVQALKNIEDLQNRNLQLEDELKAMQAERDSALSAADKAAKEAEELREQNGKLTEENDALRQGSETAERREEALTALAKLLSLEGEKETEELAEERAALISRLQELEEYIPEELAEITRQLIDGAKEEQK